MAFLTGPINKFVAWAILAGGGLLVISIVYATGNHKGAVAALERAQLAVFAKREADRAINFEVNKATITEGASLTEQEAQIREHWATVGRAPAPAPAKVESK